MWTLVTGGRDYPHRTTVNRILDKLHVEEPITVLVHGDAGKYKMVGPRLVAYSGADALAGRWASEHGVQQIKCPANWEGKDNAAGMLRNRFMLEEFPKINRVIAFPGDVGTGKMMMLAAEKGLTIIDVEDMLPELIK